MYKKLVCVHNIKTHCLSLLNASFHCHTLSKAKLFYVNTKRFCSAHLKVNHLYANGSENKIKTFDEMLSTRFSEASKSVVIDLHNVKKISQVYSICSVFGNIAGIYKCNHIQNKKIVIVEFVESGSVDALLNRVQQSSRGCLLPRLPCLTLDKEHVDMTNSFSNIQDILQESDVIPPDDILRENMFGCESVCDQIKYFCNATQMTEEEWRLRFITCRKMELILPGFLSEARVYPFGSSVSGFGRSNADLDMLIDVMGNGRSQDPPTFPLHFSNKNNNDNSFDRSDLQKHLEMRAADMNANKLGFKKVVRILHATVPIIKFVDENTSMECDITVNNLVGLYMTQLLYTCACYDSRIRPLVCAVRLWARGHNITKAGQPGRGVSNFSLTLLVLFHLMNTTPSILPNFKVFKSLAEKQVLVDGIDVSFVQNTAVVPMSKNNSSLEELLVSFFECYSSFDFKNRAISLITGETFQKPSFHALYLQNPIEVELNVTRNMNLEETINFQHKCLEAATILRNKEFLQKSTKEWGLQLLHSPMKRTPTPIPFAVKSKNSRKQQMVNIQQLLQDVQHMQVPPQSKGGEQQSNVILRKRQKGIRNIPKLKF